MSPVNPKQTKYKLANGWLKRSITLILSGDSAATVDGRSRVAGGGKETKGAQNPTATRTTGTVAQHIP